MRTYTILVCPKCGDGPLLWDPEGIDRAEGMSPRAWCVRDHLVLFDQARRLEVMPRLDLCLCGTQNASRCPLHVNPVFS